MFRIVEREDGSTAIFERNSGKRLCVIPPSLTICPCPGPGEGGAGAPTPDVAHKVTLSRGEQPQVLSSLTVKPLSPANQMPSAPVASTVVSPMASNNGSGSTNNASAELETRSLRQRKGVDYNEDKKFQLLMSPKLSPEPPVNVSKPLPKAASSAELGETSGGPSSGPGPGVKKKPDHLVVVFKQSEKEQSREGFSPSKMRLLPAATLNKLQQECKGKKRQFEEVLVPEEPESDCIDEDAFFKYLNLIPSRVFAAKTKETLQSSWPLRLINRTNLTAKSVDSGKTVVKVPLKLEMVKNGVIPQARPAAPGVGVAIPGPVPSTSSSGFNPNPQKQPLVMTIDANDAKILFNSQTTTGVLKNQPQQVLQTARGLWVTSSAAFSGTSQRTIFAHPNGSVLLHCQDPNKPPPTLQQQQATPLEQLRQQTIKFITKYADKLELTSPLGKRMLESFPYLKAMFSPRNSVEHKLIRVKAYEKFCGTNAKLLQHLLVNVMTVVPNYDLIAFNASNSSSSKNRILRSTNAINGTVTCLWGPRYYSHTYTFTKSERLEKWLSLETGLDWRSRLLAWHCSPIAVPVDKLTHCPCCRESVDEVQAHACGHDLVLEEEEMNMNISGSSVIETDSEDCQSEDMVEPNRFSSEPVFTKIVTRVVEPNFNGGCALRFNVNGSRRHPSARKSVTSTVVHQLFNDLSNEFAAYNGDCCCFKCGSNSCLGECLDHRQAVKVDRPLKQNLAKKSTMPRFKSAEAVQREGVPAKRRRDESEVDSVVVYKVNSRVTPPVVPSSRPARTVTAPVPEANSGYQIIWRRAVTPPPSPPQVSANSNGSRAGPISSEQLRVNMVQPTDVSTFSPKKAETESQAKDSDDDIVIIEEVIVSRTLSKAANSRPPALEPQVAVKLHNVTPNLVSPGNEGNHLTIRNSRLFLTGKRVVPKGVPPRLSSAAKKQA